MGRLIGGSDVVGDVGGQRRLAHAWAAGDDDQIRRLQATHAMVEIAQAGGNAGQVAIAHIGRAGHVDGILQRIGKAFETAIVAAVFGQLEQPPLGILDLFAGCHVDRRVIGDVDHVFADGDQRAARRKVIDGAAIVGGVDDGHSLDRQPHDILRHRHVPNLLVGRQEGFQCDRRRHLAHTDELGRHLIDLAVQRLVEMAGLEEVRDAVEGVVVDEDGAEQRLLGLDVVWRFTIKRCFRDAEFSRCLCHDIPDFNPGLSISERDESVLTFLHHYPTKEP